MAKSKYDIMRVMKSKNVKKRIGFDLDGVLADHAKNRKKTTKSLGLKENSEEVKEIIYGELSLTAGVIKGAKKAVRTLDKDFELFVISRRRQKHGRYAMAWLKENFNFSPKNIFFVDKKKDKADVVKKLGVGFFIDDDASVLGLIPDNVKKFLFTGSFDEFLELVKKEK